MDQDQFFFILTGLAIVLAIALTAFFLLKPRKHIVRYSTGEIRRVWYSKRDKPFGIDKIFYQNGALNKQKEYKDGLLHGTVYTYYPNGKAYIEEEYADGLLIGEVKIYEEDGSLRECKKLHSDNESAQEIY